MTRCRCRVSAPGCMCSDCSQRLFTDYDSYTTAPQPLSAGYQAVVPDTGFRMSTNVSWSKLDQTLSGIFEYLYCDDSNRHCILLHPIVGWLCQNCCDGPPGLPPMLVLVLAPVLLVAVMALLVFMFAFQWLCLPVFWVLLVISMVGVRFCYTISLRWTAAHYATSIDMTKFILTLWRMLMCTVVCYFVFVDALREGAGNLTTNLLSGWFLINVDRIIATAAAVTLVYRCVMRHMPRLYLPCVPRILIAAFLGLLSVSATAAFRHPVSSDAMFVPSYVAPPGYSDMPTMMNTFYSSVPFYIAAPESTTKDFFTFSARFQQADLSIVDGGSAHHLVPDGSYLNQVSNRECSNVVGMGSTRCVASGSATAVFRTESGFTKPRRIRDVLVTPD